MSFNGRVNGVKVRSDKDLTSISNNRIVFSDGSWCDVGTGDIVNKGSGFIKMGRVTSQSDDASPESSEPLTIGPTLYPAQVLELNRLQAEVVVEPYDGSSIEVTIVGPKAAAEAITATANHGILVLSGGSKAGDTDITIIGGRGSSFISRSSVFRSSSVTISSGDMVVSNLGSSRPKVLVTIKVPTRVPVSVIHPGGNTRIGDTKGPLTAVLHSVHGITAGIVSDVDLKLGNTGSVTISEAHGAAKIKASSTGSARIGGGSITDLSASTSSTGEISVANVNGPAYLRASSTGGITVRDGNISRLSAETSSIGGIRVGGTAQRATLSTTSIGSINVAHVVEPPDKHASSLGRISIGRVG